MGVRAGRVRHNIRQEYFSNIRGRHSYIHAEASATELPRSLRYPVHLVAAMDAETVFTHFGDLQRGSYLVYDQGEDGSDFSKIPSMEPELRERLRNAFREAGIDGTLGSLVRWLSQSRGVVPIGISYASVLSDAQKGAGIVASQASRYVSAILIGAVAGLAGLSDGAVSYGLARRFPRKELYEHNLYIVRSVMSQVREKFGCRCRSTRRPSASANCSSRAVTTLWPWRRSWAACATSPTIP
ncbi:MAG: 2-oxoacid:acceptor oxidoreductase family protein [Conexivisphaera sp.]